MYWSVHPSTLTPSSPGSAEALTRPWRSRCRMDLVVRTKVPRTSPSPLTSDSHWEESSLPESDRAHPPAGWCSYWANLGRRGRVLGGDTRLLCLGARKRAGCGTFGTTTCGFRSLSCIPREIGRLPLHPASPPAQQPRSEIVLAVVTHL
jgi:hypothetical protein